MQQGNLTPGGRNEVRPPGVRFRRAAAFRHSKMLLCSQGAGGTLSGWETSLIRKHWRLPPPLLLVVGLLTALLVIQPAARRAQADEPAPPALRVVGVGGVPLRAEPNGSSIALAIVPAGGSVSL